VRRVKIISREERKLSTIGRGENVSFKGSRSTAGRELK
jgi:hypothetical protein